MKHMRLMVEYIKHDKALAEHINFAVANGCIVNYLPERHLLITGPYYIVGELATTMIFDYNIEQTEFTNYNRLNEYAQAYMAILATAKTPFGRALAKDMEDKMRIEYSFAFKEMFA